MENQKLDQSIHDFKHILINLFKKGHFFYSRI